MAQLEQPSATVNGKTPKVSAPESNTTRPTRTAPLLVAGVLAALVICAGAYFYYQDEPEAGTAAATTPQSATSGNTASAPTESAPLGAQGTASSTPSTKPLPQDESRARAIANAAPSPGHSAKTRHMASKSAALASRDRQIALATPPKPTYPLQALRAREQGTVLVLAQVNVDGQVTDARVVGHSGSLILDRAAPKEVRGWKFDPAMHNGRPVVASIEVPVNYRLNQ
jgi:TonB family protein